MEILPFLIWPFVASLILTGIHAYLGVHVVERGTGPCVILLHGNGSMVEDFASTGLIDRLAENHRVLAFDRPGFGESDRDGRTCTPEREADLLAEVMQTLGVQTSVLVGHSWGGW